MFNVENRSHKSYRSVGKWKNRKSFDAQTPYIGKTRVQEECETFFGVSISFPPAQSLEIDQNSKS